MVALEVLCPCPYGGISSFCIDATSLQETTACWLPTAGPVRLLHKDHGLHIVTTCPAALFWWWFWTLLTKEAEIAKTKESKPRYLVSSWHFEELEGGKCWSYFCYPCIVTCWGLGSWGCRTREGYKVDCQTGFIVTVSSVVRQMHLHKDIPPGCIWQVKKNKLNRNVITLPTPYPVMLWTLKPWRIRAEAFVLHFSSHWPKTAERCTEGSCKKLLLGSSLLW